MKASKHSRRIEVMKAAEHRANVEAAAAADRHARDFTAMFSINSPSEAMEPSAQYLADIQTRSQA
jgi:hypothetical protein